MEKLYLSLLLSEKRASRKLRKQFQSEKQATEEEFKTPTKRIKSPQFSFKHFLIMSIPIVIGSFFYVILSNEISDLQARLEKQETLVKIHEGTISDLYNDLAEIARAPRDLQQKIISSWQIKRALPLFQEAYKKNPKIRINSTIDLRNLTSLEMRFDKFKEAEIIIFSQALSHLQNLTSINLDFSSTNGISNRGFPQFSWAISNLTNLTAINLNFAWAKWYSEDELIVLGQNISKLPSLTSLDLSFRGNMKITDEVLEKFSESLLDCKFLKELYLDFSMTSTSAKLTEQIKKKFDSGPKFSIKP